MKKWYIVFLSGIVFAGFAYGIHSYFCKNASAQILDPRLITEITTEEEATQIRSGLSEDAIKEIDICFERIARMQELKTYMNEAILMKIDPYNCKKITIEYEASSELLASARNLTNQYISFVNTDDTFKTAISAAIDDPEDVYHISDVVTATEVSAVQQGAVNIVRIDIGIAVDAEWDEDKIITAVRDAIESYRITQPDGDANVTFDFFRASSITKFFSDIQNLQTKVMSQYNSDTSALGNATKNLDRPSAILYNYELQKKGLENDYNVWIPDPDSGDLLEAEESRGIAGKIADISTGKIVILGFGGGVFIACGIIMLYWIARGKAGRIFGISVMSDRPVFGILNCESKKNQDEVIDSTIANISFFLHRFNQEKIDIICMGKPGEECKETMNELCELLKEKEGIESCVYNITVEDTLSYQKLLDVGHNAILCIAFEKNSIKEIYTLEQQLTAVNVELIGSIGVE